MNEATFIWSEIYEEFATKLLEYKNNRKNLISKLQNVYEEIDKAVYILEHIKDKNSLKLDNVFQSTVCKIFKLKKLQLKVQIY